jgi:hypothetical protein
MANEAGISRKSIFVHLLLIFVVESSPTIAFQYVNTHPLTIPGQGHAVNSYFSGKKALVLAQSGQLATLRTPPHQMLVTGVRQNPYLNALRCKVSEEEMQQDSTLSSAQSEIMQEFLSLYQAAVDAGTFIKCTLSANKGEDR